MICMQRAGRCLFIVDPHTERATAGSACIPVPGASQVAALNASRSSIHMVPLEWVRACVALRPLGGQTTRRARSHRLGGRLRAIIVLEEIDLIATCISPNGLWHLRANHMGRGTCMRGGH